MKKLYITLAITATALFATSCDNEEIEIVSSPTVLDITTNRIMDFNGLRELASNNKWSYYDLSDMADLQSLNSNYRLRVRNLVYDKTGVLIKDEAQFISTYSQNIRNELMLPVGEYTVVTLSDVVQVNGSGEITFRFWSLQDSTRLSRAKVADTGYLGGKNKVLAASTTRIIIDGTSRTYNVTPRPVGALIFILYENIHALNSTKRVTLLSKKVSSDLSFSDNGFIYNYKQSSTYDWRYDYMEPASNPNSAIVYDYAFVFESENTPIAWRYIDNANNAWTVADGVVNFKAGDFWYAHIDMGTIENEEEERIAFVIQANEFVRILDSAEGNARKIKTPQIGKNVIQKKANSIHLERLTSIF